MDRDIREGAAFRRTEEFFRRWMEPGFGRVTVAVEPSVRPDGGAVAVTGTVFEKLEGPGRTRIAVADDHGISIVTSGDGDDRCPRWSPDGRVLAFLSDRRHGGVFALHLLRAGIEEAAVTAPVEGTVEYCSWSPDGRRVLLGVAGLGADVAGGQGSGTITVTTSGDGAAWMPDVGGGLAVDGRRSVWVYDVEEDAARRVSPERLNVWEAAWLGPDRIAAVASRDPGEGAWYTAELTVIDIADGSRQVVFKPRDQIGWPAGSPAGHLLAVVEAVCSDRWIVAGDLRLVHPVSGTIRTVDTAGVDVTGSAWIDERRLGYAGIRGLHTVAGHCDTRTGTCTELILESYDQPPAITLVTRDGTKELASLSHPGTERLRSSAGAARSLSWSAPDGTEIQGILCRPPGEGPFPLIVLVHGGPVWAFGDRWLMRYGYTPLLVEEGDAVLHPNPRGSAGRGQRFARAVVGDMGGADTYDILAGIDAPHLEHRPLRRPLPRR